MQSVSSNFRSAAFLNAWSNRHPFRTHCNSLSENRDPPPIGSSLWPAVLDKGKYKWRNCVQSRYRVSAKDNRGDDLREGFRPGRAEAIIRSLMGGVGC